MKVVSESRVTWATSVPILVFPGLSVLDLGPLYVTDRQTDVRQHHHLMPPPTRDGGITTEWESFGWLHNRHRLSMECTVVSECHHILEMSADHSTIQSPQSEAIRCRFGHTAATGRRSSSWPVSQGVRVPSAPWHGASCRGRCSS